VETEQHKTAATATGRLHPSAVPARHYKVPEKKGLSDGIKIAIAVGASIVLAVVGIFLFNQIKASKASHRYGNLLKEVEGGAREILISRAELDRMLNEAANEVSETNQQTLFKALSIAKPNDKTDVDAVIVEFVTKSTQLLSETREAMIRLVIGKRMTASMIPALLDFARQTPDPRLALSTYQVLRPVAGDDQFEKFLSVAQFGTNAELKQAAEECAIEIMKRSKNKSKLSGIITTALGSTSNPKIKAALSRIQAAAK
jgi:hypothetical protein